MSSLSFGAFSLSGGPGGSSGGSSGASHAETIGDGASTTIVVTHGLATRDVDVTIREAASPYGVVSAQWEATDTTTITLYFGSPPATNEFRVKVST